MTDKKAECIILYKIYYIFLQRLVKIIIILSTLIWYRSYYIRSLYSLVKSNTKKGFKMHFNKNKKIIRFLCTVIITNSLFIMNCFAQSSITLDINNENHTSYWKNTL